jgi:hypothetical protein
VSLSLLCAVIVCAPRIAAAQPVVELAGETVFDAGELATALAVRVGPRAVHVRVTPTDDGVIVEIGGAARAVPLGEARGEAAARLVALAASDLVLDDLATPPTTAPGEAPRDTGAAVDGQPPRAPTTIAITGAAASGWNGVLGGVTAHLTVPRGAWLGVADVGGVTLVDGAVDLTGAIVRLGAGRRLGWLDVRAGATLVPITVSAGAGDRTVLFGGGASVFVRLPLARGLRAVFAGGVDVFATRTEYTMEGSPTAATPWIAPWLGAGLELAP